MDSGCIPHVTPPEVSPGAPIRESAGSRRGQRYSMADGGEKPNLGETDLGYCTSDGTDKKRTYQVADISRLIKSIGEVCDDQARVVFGANWGSCTA